MFCKTILFYHVFVIRFIRTSAICHNSYSGDTDVTGQYYPTASPSYSISPSCNRPGGADEFEFPPSASPTGCGDHDDLCEAVAVGDVLMPVCDWLQTFENATEFQIKCDEGKFPVAKPPSDACEYLQAFPESYDKYCDDFGNYTKYRNIKRGQDLAYLNVGLGEICAKTCDKCGWGHPLSLLP